VADVKRAFRQLAFATHPDRPGGSHAAFLRAQSLLDEALASPPPAAQKSGRVAQRYGVGEFCGSSRTAGARPAHSTYA
jgi:curved DNA-binding protein CbpA